MAYPSEPLGVVTELHVNGAWVDVSGHVRTAGGTGIALSRGRADQGVRADPSRAGLSVNNRDGRYSPRNPMSPYYGLIGRNTPVRIGVQGSSTYLAMPGDVTSKATTPDVPALGITGDIDIRVDLELTNWRERVDLAAKYVTAGNQRSWAFYLRGGRDGVPGFSWSTSGTSGTTIDVVGTEPVPAPPSGRQALAVVLDVNNGAGGHSVIFFVAPTIAGPWTQLGDAVTMPGTTSIFDGTAPIELGDTANLTALPVQGRIYGFQLRSGINGTPVASVDFTTQTPGATSVVDTAGRTWNIQGNAKITNVLPRFAGEVSAWPARWDVSGQDVWVPIEAAGILRRLGAGRPVEGSVFYRALAMDAKAVVAYWPLEDAAGSTSLAAASPLTAPMTITGEPALASFDEFDASAPLPIMSGAIFSGAAPAYAPTGQTQVRFLLAPPALGDADDQTLVTWYTTGTLRRWEVHYGTGGTLGLRAYDAGGGLIFDTGDVAFAADGRLLIVSAEATENGANVDWTLSALEVGQSVGSTFGSTAAGQTVGRVGQITVSPAGGLDGTAIGHLSVQTTVTSLFELADQLNAWRGETAGRRIERLCREEGVPLTIRGDALATSVMGPQAPATLLDLLDECAETDAGILYEPRDRLGICYRTRESLYNQTPRAELDYAAGHISPPLEPTDDDTDVRNDITVTRQGGSSARAVLDTGPLSVADPPDGIGRYDTSFTVNSRYDVFLSDHASWRLHVRTVDEARWPVVTWDLSRLLAVGEVALAETLAELDVGDRITIEHLPEWLPPEDIDVLTVGMAEFLAQFDWVISANCTPARPYNVAAWDVTGRYGPHSTVTAEPLDTTETGVDITTPVGPLWSTSASGYDVMIGGERMTVTAVSAPSGTGQTLTVVRSVNGVVKAHASGAAVVLAEPAVYAL